MCDILISHMGGDECVNLLLYYTVQDDKFVLTVWRNCAVSIYRGIVRLQGLWWQSLQLSYSLNISSFKSLHHPHELICMEAACYSETSEQTSYTV